MFTVSGVMQIDAGRAGMERCWLCSCVTFGCVWCVCMLFSSICFIMVDNVLSEVLLLVGPGCSMVVAE